MSNSAVPASTTDLSDVLHDVLTFVNEALPEISLLASDGTVSVPVGGPITGLRLDLHHDRIELSTVGLSGLAPDPGAVTLRSNGFTDHGEPDLAALMSLDACGHVATDRSDHAWLEMRWQESVAAESIVLRNDGTTHGQRAAGLVVSALGPDGTWDILLDGAARIEAVRSAVVQRSLQRHPDDVQLQYMCLLLFRTAVGEYPSAREGAKTFKPEISVEQLAVIKKTVNPVLLKDRQREWTTHGIQRSFRFWNAEEKREYVEYAVVAATDLADLTPNVCFGFGAALCVVRDSDMIPHDDDLDLIIAFDPSEAPDLATGLRLVEKHLRARGYTVAGNFFAHRHVSKTGHKKKIDVFVGLFEGDDVAWYPGPRGNLTRDSVFPTSQGSVFGITVPLPRDPDRYLESQYGPGWKTPDPEFKHSWTRARFKDLGKPADDPAAVAAPAKAPKVEAPKVRPEVKTPKVRLPRLRRVARRLLRR